MLRRIATTVFLFLLTAWTAIAQTATVGDGMLSVGQYNVFNPQTGQTLNFSTCLKNALAHSQHVQILAGNYNVNAVTAIAPDDVEIAIDSAATLTIANTAAIAVFNVTGNNCYIHGGHLKKLAFTASQTYMKFTSCKDATVRDMVLETTFNAEADSTTSAAPTPVAAPTGDTSTPMVMLEFSSVLRKHVDHCAFLPDYAVTCLKSTDGQSIEVTHCQFANNIDAGLQAIEVTPTFLDNPAPRLCWRGIQIDGDEWGTIDGCRFWGLGDAAYDPGSGALPYYTGIAATTGAQINASGSTFTLASGTWTTTPIVGSPVIMANFANAANNGRFNVVSATSSTIVTSSTLTTETGGGDESAINYPYELDFAVRIKTSTGHGGTVLAPSEGGHFRFVNNTAEWCAAPKEIRVWGAPSVVIEANVLGLDASPDALGEGIIVITDGDNGATGTDVSRDIVIVGNSIHNPALTGTSGAAIFAQMCSDLIVKSNDFSVLASKYAIELAGASTIESPNVTGNSFRGSGVRCIAPVHINTGAGLSNGIIVSNNDIEGFANVVAADDPATGIVTSSGTGTAGVDDFMGTVSNTATTIVRTAGSFVTEGWAPGMVVTVAGLDTAADNANPVIVRSVVALTLTFEGYPFATAGDADNGTNVVLTEVTAPSVVNDSSSVADYFLEGLQTQQGNPWKSVCSTGPLTNITIASNVISRAAGSFLTDGFEIGNMVAIMGALNTAGDVNKVGYVSGVTALTMTLTNVTLTDDASAAEVTVIMRVAGSPTGNVSLD